MMKKIGAKDGPRPLQMCLARPLAPQPMELHLISTPTKPEEGAAGEKNANVKERRRAPSSNISTLDHRARKQASLKVE